MHEPRSHIPEVELDRVAGMGVHWVWLLSVCRDPALRGLRSWKRLARLAGAVRDHFPGVSVDTDFAKVAS